MKDIHRLRPHPQQQPSVLKMRPFHLLAYILSILIFPVISGCGTMNNGRGWGQDALHSINQKKIVKAAHNAFFNWQTLVPGAGALIFAIDDWDDKTSHWAADHTPVFGSIEDAKDSSDKLRNVLLAETIITTLITPSSDNPKQWATSKLKGLFVELAAMGAASGATSLLKEATDRRRPDDSNNNSFPSAHTTNSFSFSTLSNRNLDSIKMPQKVKRTLQIGNIVLASSVGWARVEGRRHYPSDVLAGAAFSYFLTAFIHDALMGTQEEDRFDFIIFPQKDSVEAHLAVRF